MTLCEKWHARATLWLLLLPGWLRGVHQSCLLHVSMADGPPCILILAELSQFPRVLYSLSLACSAVLHRPNLLQHGSQSRPSGVRFHLVLQTQHSICIVTNNRKNRHIQTSPFRPSFSFGSAAASDQLHLPRRRNPGLAGCRIRKKKRL